MRNGHSLDQGQTSADMRGLVSMHIPQDAAQGAPGLAPPVRVHTLPISTVGSSLGFVNWIYPFIQLVGKFRAFSVLAH